MCGRDSSTGDLDTAGQAVDTDRTRNTQPAQPPPVQDDSNLAGGRRPRRNPGDQTSWQSANNSGSGSATSVTMSPDIQYVNERHHFGPIGDAGILTRPSRDRRRPARYLSAISVSDARPMGKMDVAILEIL